jgi:hypothetical protein
MGDPEIDPDGKSLALINVEPDRNGTRSSDMAGDYRGNLYEARGDLLIIQWLTPL